MNEKETFWHSVPRAVVYKYVKRPRLCGKGPPPCARGAGRPPALAAGTTCAGIPDASPIIWCTCSAISRNSRPITNRAALRAHRMGKEAPVWRQALPKVLGILGGLALWPLFIFYEMLTRHTQAARDQDHIDVIINSRATTPDRTSYIWAKARRTPSTSWPRTRRGFVTFGADVIAIPCNTAHYFYDRLNETIPIPILNMVEETVLAAKAGGSARWASWPPQARCAPAPTSACAKKHGLPLRRAGRCRAGCRDGRYLRRHQAGPARGHGRV